jgi:hypothetical protein
MKERPKEAGGFLFCTGSAAKQYISHESSLFVMYKMLIEVFVGYVSNLQYKSAPIITIKVEKLRLFGTK